MNMEQETRKEGKRDRDAIYCESAEQSPFRCICMCVCVVFLQKHDGECERRGYEKGEIVKEK